MKTCNLRLLTYKNEIPPIFTYIDNKKVPSVRPQDQQAHRWMIGCRKSALNLAEMANVGQFATKPLTIRERDGRKRSEWVRCDEERLK